MIATAINIEHSKERVSELQRKLYLKAKQQTTFRFYTLYDKVYRSDVLQHAYDLVKKNKGSPGIDGETFETIENGKGRSVYCQELQESLIAKTYRASPVKRVEIPKPNGETRPLGIPVIKDRIVQMAVKLVIEPIFEAGFSQHSYGFRPKKSCHQAMNAITDSLLKGYVHVIDADLSKYFDTIPHRKLLQTVAEKIVDQNIFALLKQWLKAIVIKVGKTQRVISGGKKQRLGTPQGGVVSPLLANIYLNILDRIWDKQELEAKYKARLIRYADDIVILCESETTPSHHFLSTVLNKLELQLNVEKTQIKDVRKENFTFLGFQLVMAKGKQSGKYFPLIEPSDKAINEIKQKIKFYTRRSMSPVPIDDIVNKLNETVRGWSNYFYYGHGHKKLKKVKYYMEERLRLHLRYRHKLKNRGAAYHRFPRKYIYDYLNLYKVPITPKWKVVHA